MNFDCLFFIGLVERSNRTVEDCIKKIVVSREDSESVLLSVLFALRVSRHSFTGMFPYMVYTKEILSYLFNKWTGLTMVA